MATRLERLNSLLASKKLDLPDFRREVTPSFGNLKWLQKALLKNPDCPAEVKTLLQMDPKSLLAEEQKAA